MRTYSWRTIGLAALCAALLAFPIRVGHTATLILPIKTQSVPSEQSGSTAILIDFGTLDALRGMKILYAKCYLNLRLDSCTTASDGLEVKPLTESWEAVASGAISLTDSTRRAVTDAFSTDADIGRGPEEDTGILLTELLQAWVDKRMANNGLVLLSRSSGCVYELMTKSEYPSGGYGELLVRFTKKSQ
jgi:hypothetical protein